MNILKIVDRISELFGVRYFAEGTIARLSGPPNVLKKNRFKIMRWNIYPRGMVVVEDPERLKPVNYALTLDVRSAIRQIDIHYILLAFGVFILLLFAIAGLKMMRKRQRRPTSTKIGQQEEDEVFFDCQVFPDFQSNENKVFVDFQKGFQYEIEWIIELQSNKEQVIPKLQSVKKKWYPYMPSNKKEGLTELKSRNIRQSDKEFPDLPSDTIQPLIELQSIKTDLNSKSAKNPEPHNLQSVKKVVRNLKCKKADSKSRQHVEWPHFRRLTEEECLMPPQVD